MAFDAGLVDRVRETLADEPGLTEKRLFGSYGFLLDGNMCAGVQGERLITRAPMDQYDLLLTNPNVSKFPSANRSMRGWITVDPSEIAEDDDLARLVGMGVAVARSLPPK